MVVVYGCFRGDGNVNVLLLNIFFSLLHHRSIIYSFFIIILKYC